MTSPPFISNSKNVIHTYQLWKMQIFLHMLCISIRSSLPIGTGTNNNGSMIRNHGHIGKLAVIRQNFKRITWVSTHPAPEEYLIHKSTSAKSLSN